jgi:uncharacterized membrane protein YccC
VSARSVSWQWLADAVRVDRSALRPGPAAKAAAGVIIPIVVGVVIAQPAAGAAASFGALSVGVAIITAGPRPPIGTLLAASIGMGAATFIGSVSGLVPPVHLVVLAAFGFLAGLLVAAGRGATQVGVNATIALLVFGRNAAGPELAAVHASWVLAGGLLQVAIAAMLRSPAPLKAQREALAAGYEALARTADEPPAPAVADAAVTARDAIYPWLRDEDRAGAEPLRGLAGQLDRIRQEFHALHFQRRPGNEQPQIDEALALMAAGLSEIAAALRTRSAPTGIGPIAAKLVSIADELGQADEPGVPAQPPARFASARIAALAGQLRASGRMATELSGTRRISLPVAASYTADAMIVLPSQLRSALRQVEAALSPSSPAFRHAVRLAVVIPAATEISRLLPWPRGYWVAITTVIVLKPDFTATVSRGIARTVGTGIGIIAAAIIVTTTHPQGLALIICVGVAAWLGYTVFVANYAVYSVFLTALVILLVSAAQRSAVTPVENRGFDTLIGGAIAIIAYLVWPTWEAKTLQAATAERFEANRAFLQAVLEVYLEPAAQDRAALAGLAAATRRAQSNVTASMQRARGEPARIRPDLHRYASLLAAARRIVAGTHALASHLADSRQQVAVPAAAVMAGQLDDAMAELVDSISANHPPGDLPALRQSQRKLAADSAASLTPADRRGAILAALLDPLVDSIDTAADLLATNPSPDPPPPKPASPQTHLPPDPAPS